MSPSFIRKALAKLHRKAVTTQKGASNTATLRDSISEPPPSYSTVQHLSNAGVSQPSGDHQALEGPMERAIGNSREPAERPQLVDRRLVVQLCPHETLSFERMQRVLNLPDFKESRKAIDALGATAVPQHTRRQRDSLRRCNLPHKENYVGTGGYVQLRYVSTEIHLGKDLMGYSGLELSISWTLYPILFTNPSSSKKSLKLNLGKFSLSICPHHAVNDSAIVGLIHKVMHPDDLLMDPIDEWLAKVAPERHGKPYKHACTQCATVCEISGTKSNPTLQIKRYLGKGTSANDPVWEAQCVIQEHS